MTENQILANQGPDLRFVHEANFKPLLPKWSQSSTTIIQNRAHTNHELQPNSNLPNYQHAYRNTDLCKNLFSVNELLKAIKQEIRQILVSAIFSIH